MSKCLNKMSAFGNWLTNTIILFISLFTGLLICEWVVGVIPPPGFDTARFAIVRPHLTRGFEFVPNVSRERWGVDWNINNEGFRDYEHAIVKQDFRITGLGDSFLVGHEVSFEDTFLRRLERKLKIEIVKMAVTNYGTIQEYVTWEEVGRKYNPDIVLLGVYVGNDLYDNAGFPYSTCIDAGHFVRCGDPSYLSVKATRFLAKHSLVARFILQRFHQYLPKASGQDRTEDRKNQGDVFRNLNRPSVIYKKEWDELLTRGYELLKENIMKLQKSAKIQKAELIIIIIPTELQIYDWQWNKYLKEFLLNESEYDRNKVIHLLSDFLTGSKVRYVNLLPSFKQAAKIGMNLHPEHWHWSVEANKLAAREVEKYLIQNKLVPSRQSSFSNFANDF